MSRGAGCLRIGVLFGFHVFEGGSPGPFTFPIIRGMQSAARDHRIHLLVACGVSRRRERQQRPAWPVLDAETDFTPVGPENTDGLIFVAPLLTEARLRYARNLADAGFPVVFIGRDAGGPAIFVDSEGGIRKAVEHLVRHGHRSVGFIAGYEQDPGDSKARLDAYRAAVDEFGLDPDPRLVEYGDHWNVGGNAAMKRMIRSGAAFTAVLCSNDDSAIGAMRALGEEGRRIPGDVAVVGFDDVLESLAQVPPLTSVHFPMFETGYRSVLMLEKRIAGGPEALPESTRVSTWLAARQSCGCLPEAVIRSGDSRETLSADGLPRRPAARELSDRLLQAIMSEAPRGAVPAFTPLCDRLAEGFVGSLETDDPALFGNALSEVLLSVEMMENDRAHIWQAAVNELRLATYAARDWSADPDALLRFENLLHRARMLLGESAERRYARLQANNAVQDEEMGVLTARLISASEESQIYGALREGLPRVGVGACNVFFFEPRGNDPAAVSRLQPLEKDAPVLRFETRSFPPPAVYPDGVPRSQVILPMRIRNTELGYVAFDGGNLNSLATLMRQIASSVLNVRLHAEVRELSLTDELTGLHNRRFFDIILQKEIERSRRYQRHLAVVLLDIDRFKDYNDAFGHPAGDDALREVARCIGRNVRREVDVAARFGGEEFILILPETDAAGAREAAEKIRAAVEENSLVRRPVTVSLGVASMSGGEKNLPDLVDRSDRALYQAKSRGRNRTVVYEEWMLTAAHTPADPDGPGRPAD
jgi:diguanylate cyclase (GGDEF)-like protein